MKEGRMHDEPPILCPVCGQTYEKDNVGAAEHHAVPDHMPIPDGCFGRE
jgi:hypothetical protein